MARKLSVALAAVMIVLGPWVGSAQQAAPRLAPPAPSERIQNLDRLKDKLKQYHACTCACGCYSKDLDLEADRALAFLRQRAARNPRHQKLALVLDIDETTLSNYDEMLKADFAYDSKAFDVWVESASAPAIPGTLRLYKAAQQLGVRVFFLTGRPKNERAATEKNLHAAGFDAYQELILRAPEEASWSALAYKSTERDKIRAQGYTIVLNVGDQWSDLRGNPEAEFSVKYPNPFYFIP